MNDTIAMPDRDTVLCMSLSGRPSNIGTRFHNFLYRELGLNYLYKAFTTTDLPAAIGGVRSLGIRGCAISMPFKESVIELVDVMEPSATAIDSVNTIVNVDGVLHAYNTDYAAVASLLSSNAVNPALPAAVAGSGGMAKAVVAALRDHGCSDVTVVARNAEAGTALAGQYGFRHATSAPDGARVLVNATPVGMAGGPAADDLSFPAALIAAADTVFDVVAMPPETPLVRAGRAAGATVITGAEMIALQAAEQFVLYTGVRPDPDLVRRASEYSRS
ncbi:shikimate 5-dehydrogenase [Tsukamurella pseudospumae]|uniref:Shikimate dehydrogenase n=1 Tax=Tsukamurella pseudospumae TaxID=239498 RepID=A0A137ZHW1_9ACTN|nr:shikimate 5-dehydrogenase [Tsukamurella pseudospumae]KXO97772.1 shikimate dehydrogenase [Tsukamurella pseudospumae]